MKKVFLVLALLLAATWSIPANAYMVSDTVNSPSPPFNDWRYFDEDFGWTHAPISGSINSASVSITAYDVDSSGEGWNPSDPEVDNIKAWDNDSVSWVLLGILAGADNTTSTTTFSVPSDLFDEVASGLTLMIESDSTHNFLVYGVQVTSSTLTADVVPLPPSLLLFGSGLLGLVGWRRFRKG